MLTSNKFEISVLQWLNRDLSRSVYRKFWLHAWAPIGNILGGTGGKNKKFSNVR